MTPAIRARGWGWRHAGRRQWAVRGLDLEVWPGERLLLLGASGAGKSTLLAAVAGLLNAPESGDQEGELEVQGGRSEGLAGHVGVVFQDPSSNIVMGRLGDEVAFGLENQAVPSSAIWPLVREALATVHLNYPLPHPTGWLSGGEQQRLAIADIVAMAPAIWLMDEPTANLDPEGAALVVSTLQSLLRASRSTLVLVEHRIGPVLGLVDRVVVLEPGGGVMADGAPSQVFQEHGPALRKAGVWVPGPRPGRLAPPRSPGPAVVSAEEASAGYRGNAETAISGVNLSACAGQVLAITGPNGSGKSTLALALASLLPLSGGNIRFLGAGPDRPYQKWRPRELVKRVGMVFQEPEHQFVSSSVAAELEVGPRSSGLAATESKRRVGELIERLNLSHLANANPFTLSGGEKRRLSVATALANDPSLLVLDEPTFGQDARTWDEVVALLGQQRDAGRAVVAVTHDEELVACLADGHARLDHGHLVGSTRVPQELKGR